MSLIVAPEAVAVVTPPIVARPAAPRPDTRPIEASDKSNAGSSEQKQDTASRSPTAKPDPTGKPEPSARPPGTDPSLPPQAIFDASLISEDFKPTLRTEAPPPPQDDADGRNNGDTPVDTSDASAGTAESATPDASTSVQGESHLAETQSIASYARAGGGSALNAPASANPDWLTAIERIA